MQHAKICQESTHTRLRTNSFVSFSNTKYGSDELASASSSCSICITASIYIWDTYFRTSYFSFHTYFNSLFSLAAAYLDSFESIFNFSTCSINSLIILISVDWEEYWRCFSLVNWLDWNFRSNKCVSFPIALSWETASSLYSFSLSLYSFRKDTSCFSWEIFWEASLTIT